MSGRDRHGPGPGPGHRHHHDRAPDRRLPPDRDLVPPRGRPVLHHRHARPSPADWYANLVAHPGFTFHLKESATADLPAIARPVTDPVEREKVFAGLLAPLSAFTAKPGQEPEVWVAGSPLVEVTFP